MSNIVPHQLDPVDWKVTLVDTGDETLTGQFKHIDATICLVTTCLMVMACQISTSIYF